MWVDPLDGTKEYTEGKHTYLDNKSASVYVCVNVQEVEYKGSGHYQLDTLCWVMQLFVTETP